MEKLTKILDIVGGLLLLPIIATLALLVGILLFVATTLWVWPVVAAFVWSPWWLLAEAGVATLYYCAYRAAISSNNNGLTEQHTEDYDSDE